MKILKINLFIFCCICAVIVSSCEKENEIEPVPSTKDIAENQKRNDDFFSNRKTYERLGNTAHNWNKANQAFLRSENEDIDELKDYVDNLDILLNDKYVNKIIANEGYPLWDASKVHLLDNGGSIVFTPIFKDDSDKINAIFVYSEFESDKNSYILMSREKMEAIASDPKDPNFYLLNKIYKEFDSELFAFDSPQYDDWAELVLAVDLGCYLQLSIANDGLNDVNYVVCTSGCINDLLDSGIVDEVEESIWVKGNCSIAAVIDNFLQTNGTNNSDVIAAAEIILELAILGDLSSSELSAITENLGSELIFLLGEGVLSNLCESSISSSEMIGLVLNTPEISAYSVEDFYGDLEENFDFVIETESFTSNEKIKCIWDLISDVNTSLYCSTIDNFYSSPEFDLFLFVGNSPGRCAITRNNYPQGEISITFDAACIEERTVIELVKTFLHEGIHAELFRIVKSIGGYENLTPENYPEIWEAYRTHEEWSHEFMANWYLEKLADSLAEIDGNSFSTDHYIALAWQGLGENPNDPEHPISIRWQNLSSSEKQVILTLRSESSLICE